MKKYLGLMVMVLFLMPMVVNASVQLAPQANCEANGNQMNCTFNVSITNDSVTEKTIYFTPMNGAVIDNVEIDPSASLEWEIKEIKKETQNGAVVWYVTVKHINGAASTWDGRILKYTYTKSADANCEVSYNLQTTTTTTPAENPKTGSTLPYIALGAIVVIAAGAYVATRNKAKMYKI